MSFKNLNEMDATEVVPGFHGKFVHSDHVTFAHWHIEKNATLPEHSHEHEQITSVQEGKLKLTIQGETKTMGSGEIAVIPPNVTHSGKALAACKVIDVFYPVREEYIQE